MSYKFLKSVKFIKSMFPAGTFFRITEATDGKYVYNCLSFLVVDNIFEKK